MIKYVQLQYFPGGNKRNTIHTADGRILTIEDFLVLRAEELGGIDKARSEVESLFPNFLKTSPEQADSLDISQETPSGLVMLDTVTPEPVNWLWHGHIPLGKLTVLDGDPGLGKSTVTLDLVARVSRGAAMPDGSPGVSGGAVLLTLEDGLADTIIPRLNAIEADLSRIVALETVHDETGNPRLPTVKDIEAIKQACEKVHAKIIIIDPIMAHLDGTVNSWRDQDIRGALTPLCKLADQIGVAVIVVRHLNKASGAPAIYRGGGSIGIIGAARCAFLVAKDPDDECRRVFAGIKNNLAPMPTSLSFYLEGAGGASRVLWGGISNHGADALLAIQSSSEEPTVLDEAKEFLRDLLVNGPVEAKRVLNEAKAAGITDATLRRAKKALRIRGEKLSFKDGWSWILDQDAQEHRRCSLNNDEHLRVGMNTFETNDAPMTTAKPTEKAPWTTEI